LREKGGKCRFPDSETGKKKKEHMDLHSSVNLCGGGETNPGTFHKKSPQKRMAVQEIKRNQKVILGEEKKRIGASKTEKAKARSLGEKKQEGGRSRGFKEEKRRCGFAVGGEKKRGVAKVLPVGKKKSPFLQLTEEGKGHVRVSLKEGGFFCRKEEE